MKAVLIWLIRFYQRGISPYFPARRSEEHT